MTIKKIYSVNTNKLFFIFLLACIFPIGNAFGHGIGTDTISSFNAGEKLISVSVEMPMSFENESEFITITATESQTKDYAKNVTFLIGLFHENEMIFRNYFFTEDGILTIKVTPSDNGDVKILGEKDDILGAWHGTESEPIQLTGPIFKDGGLYNFEIEVRTIDEPTNIIEDSGVNYADVSVISTQSFEETDVNGEQITFGTRSYFDKVSDFSYNADTKTVTIDMPFDWSEKKMSHIPVIHVETHFPKEFLEFSTPSYSGSVNGIELFKSSISVDDYSVEDERIVHFVLLQDHLRYVKNELKRNNLPLDGEMQFVLSTSEKPAFPLEAYTKSEDFKVNLSWDPVLIEPGVETNFIFTIRDGRTNDPLRNSDYTFVLIQNGKEIHRVNGLAQVGGEFEKFTFSEEQTGPTIIKFENIRNTGQETEFAMVVAPEFGTIVILILVISISSIILLSRKSSIGFASRL